MNKIKEKIEQFMKKLYSIEIPYIILELILFIGIIWVYGCLDVLRAISIWSLPSVIEKAPYMFIYSIFISLTVTRLIMNKLKCIKLIDSRLMLLGCIFSIVFLLEISVFQMNHYNAIYTNGYEGIIDVLNDEEIEIESFNIRYMDIPVEDDVKNESKAERVYISYIPDVDDSYVPDNDIEAEVPDFDWADERAKAVEHNSDIKGNSNGEARIHAYDEDMAFFRIKNINRPVTSLYIEPYFRDQHLMSINITFSDEETSYCGVVDQYINIVDDADWTKQCSMYAVGNVGQIEILSPGGLGFKSILLNRPSDLTPVMLRMLIITFIIYGICLLVVYKFSIFNLKIKDVDNKRLGRCFRVLVIIMGVYFIVMSLAFIISSESDVTLGQHDSLVDAIIHGRVDLDIEIPEKWLAIPDEYKYDVNYIGAVGLDLYNPDEAIWDIVYYNGKLYSYFGIVPVILFEVPFKLITGFYMPARLLSLLLVFVATLMLLLVWKNFSFRRMKDMPYVFYILGSLALIFTTGLAFFIRIGVIYTKVQAAGVMFISIGLYLLQAFVYMEEDKKSTDMVKKMIIVALMSLCFALAVGCRPTLVFMSLLLPLVLWREIKSYWMTNRKGFIQIALAVAIPYIIVASGLMYYNYIRFGSVTEFGIKYMVTSFSMSEISQVSLLGKLHKFMLGLYFYIFNKPSASGIFPYLGLNSVSISVPIHIAYTSGAIGIVWIPLTVIMFIGFILVLKNKKHNIQSYDRVLPFTFGVMIIVFILSGYNAIHSFSHRYEMDYYFLVVLAGLMMLPKVMESVNLAWDKAGNSEIICNIVYTVLFYLIVKSIVIGYLLTFTGSNPFPLNSNPASIMAYIQRSHEIFRGF